jgi:hypothetical protein
MLTSACASRLTGLTGFNLHICITRRVERTPTCTLLKRVFGLIMIHEYGFLTGVFLHLFLCIAY